jgi:hypothetical protein
MGSLRAFQLPVIWDVHGERQHVDVIGHLIHSEIISLPLFV